MRNWIGVSSIRMLTATRLRELKEPVTICDHSEPVAVMVPYALFIKWQVETSYTLKPAKIEIWK